MKNRQRLLGLIILIIGLTISTVFESFEYRMSVILFFILAGLWLIVRSFFIVNYTKTEFDDGSVEREIKM